MQHLEIAHPHDLLVRRFLTEPEFMADLLRHYPQNPAEQRMVALLDLERLVCKDPVTVSEQLKEIRGDLRFSTSFKKIDREANVYLLFEHQSTKDPKFDSEDLTALFRSIRNSGKARRGRLNFRTLLFWCCIMARLLGNTYQRWMISLRLHRE